MPHSDPFGTEPGSFENFSDFASALSEAFSSGNFGRTGFNTGDPLSTSGQQARNQQGQDFGAADPIAPGIFGDLKGKGILGALTPNPGSIAGSLLMSALFPASGVPGLINSLIGGFAGGKAFDFGKEKLTGKKPSKKPSAKPSKPSPIAEALAPPTNILPNIGPAGGQPAPRPSVAFESLSSPFADVLASPLAQATPPRKPELGPSTTREANQGPVINLPSFGPEALATAPSRAPLTEADKVPAPPPAPSSSILSPIRFDATFSQDQIADLARIAALHGKDSPDYDAAIQAALLQQVAEGRI